MATKDYVYLALIACAAIVFYAHGFYAGLSRRKNSKREAKTHSSPVLLPEASIFTITVDDMVDNCPATHNRLHEPEVRPSIQCVFGHN